MIDLLLSVNHEGLAIKNCHRRIYTPRCRMGVEVVVGGGMNFKISRYQRFYYGDFKIDCGNAYLIIGKC
ncbi:hypothetical protein EYC84_003593 [Monilinia fructicola]|uniref:Uncharacterized protein n=1 Tax=Monilinia fructicola TaxID=38448 RepID=A0A5M9JU62_MONFR|nr:hypothetical protein EYC84_003593 [Monilinia fructicola]